MKKKIFLCVPILLLVHNLTHAAIYQPKIEKHMTGVRFIPGRLIFQAHINDSITGLFGFDTGSSGLILDSAFSEKHFVAPRRPYGIIGTANKVCSKAQKFSKLLHVTVGNRSVQFSSIIQINMSNFARNDSLKIHLDGIIGYDFAKNDCVFVDNDDSIFACGSRVDPSKYETAIPFVYERDRIHLTTKMLFQDGTTIPLNLILDTGCSSFMVLTTPTFQKIKKCISNIPTLWIPHIDTDGHKSKRGTFVPKQFVLSTIKIEKPTITFSDNKQGSLSYSSFDGLLGNGFLSQFNYAIDYKNHILYLQKAKKPLCY